MATDTIKTSFTFTNNAMSTRERLRDPPRSTISDHMGKTRRHAKNARIPRSIRLGQSLINFKPFCGSFYVMFLVIPARTRGARHPVPGGWNNIHFASKSFNYNSIHPFASPNSRLFPSILKHLLVFRYRQAPLYHSVHVLKPYLSPGHSLSYPIIHTTPAFLPKCILTPPVCC
jgi:hypothetical protein